MYAVAASAAGVGALVLSAPAGAEVIYTKAHKAVPSYPQGLKLDLNHNGIADFKFAFTRVEGGNWLRMAVYASRYDNSVRYSTKGFPAAYPAGVRVGPTKDDVRPPKSYAGVGMESCGGSTGTFIRGPWANVNGRYLGLEFHIKGKIHYGWARLNAKVSITDNGCEMTGVLTGYAYETIPNKPIITGQTETPSASTLQAGSLGNLAQGKK
jgi:hypothetical protein